MWTKRWSLCSISLIAKFLQLPCKSGPHFMSTLKVVHRSPGSYNKVIYIIFFVMSASLTKFKSCNTLQNLRYQVLVLILCFLSVIHSQVMWQSWSGFKSLHFESRKHKHLSDHWLLVAMFNIYEIYPSGKSIPLNLNLADSFQWLLHLSFTLEIFVKHLIHSS